MQYIPYPMMVLEFDLDTQGRRSVLYSSRLF